MIPCWAASTASASEQEQTREWQQSNVACGHIARGPFSLLSTGCWWVFSEQTILRNCSHQGIFHIHLHLRQRYAIRKRHNFLEGETKIPPGASLGTTCKHHVPNKVACESSDIGCHCWLFEFLPLAWSPTPLTPDIYQAFSLHTMPLA